ncbi:lamin tail domain-containing protein [Nocardioides litoris]|uniref:lamin tail domain-containing protein n=1 Tax=Nocardioides litoris TaxID=1926648 RepID=UPI00147771C1|nr:lamin tail domain-containing protein [Nocardioides litoris]
MRAPRRPVLPTLLATALAGATLAVVGGVGVAAPASAAVTDLRINEVESSGGTPVDWIELVNTGTQPVDASGLRLKDNDDSRTLAIPDGTTIAPGAFYAIDVDVPGGFGLGSADSARLLESDGTTLIDSHIWTAHATGTTYGRCPDGTGAFRTTTSSTKGAANDCSSLLKINEVESDGGTPGDWVELVNTGAAAYDASGLRLRDSDDSHSLALPAGTTVAGGGGLLVVDVDSVGGGFGLGASDSVRLHAADGTTLLDSYTWTSHAPTSYGRCPSGTGPFATTQRPTRGAANLCPGDIDAQPWPGGPSVTTADPQGTFASNLSGLAYEPSGTRAPGTLWAVRNGAGALFRLAPTGDGGYAPASDRPTGQLLRYADGTGDVDAEGLTFTAAGPAGGAYVASERNNSVSGTSRPAVLRYETTGTGTDLRPTNDWDLSADLPGLGANAGLEAIAWVPDSYLVARGLRDQATGAAYDPSRYAGHGTGLFLVGVEQTGQVIAYALDQRSNAFTRVTSFASGFKAVMELHWEAGAQRLWVVCDDTCAGRSGLFEVKDGAFAATRYVERPAGMPDLNNEGFTTTPDAECVDGLKPVFWSDDASTGGHALRRGTLTCSATPAASTTTLVVRPAVLRATVAPTAEGAAPVTGEVAFTVDGTAVGTAPLVGGVATLAHTVPPGATRTVVATYAGSEVLAGSAATVQRQDPLARFVLSSEVPPTAEGWWSEPVTVTFTCTPQGSPVTCPEPVVLDRSDESAGVTRTVTAEDGGATTVVVDDVMVDLDDPTVRITGVRPGATYPLAAPTPRCVASDALSGVASCDLEVVRRGLVTTVTAYATDVAGHEAGTSVSWRVPAVRVVGARGLTADGRYVVRRGDRYRLEALLAASPRPRVVGPLRASVNATARGRAMKPGALAGGLTTWNAAVRAKAPARDQKVVVKVGPRRVVVRLRVVR